MANDRLDKWEAFLESPCPHEDLTRIKPEYSGFSVHYDITYFLWFVYWQKQGYDVTTSPFYCRACGMTASIPTNTWLMV